MARAKRSGRGRGQRSRAMDATRGQGARSASHRVQLALVVLGGGIVVKAQYCIVDYMPIAIPKLIYDPAYGCLVCLGLVGWYAGSLVATGRGRSGDAISEGGEDVAEGSACSFVPRRESHGSCVQKAAQASFLKCGPQQRYSAQQKWRWCRRREVVVEKSNIRGPRPIEGRRLGHRRIRSIWGWCWQPKK